MTAIPKYKNGESVCVVGGGSIGSLHIELHEKTIGVEKVGVVELDAKLRSNYASAGFNTYETIDDAIADEYKVYDICLPTYLHFDAIASILQQTEAVVVCEKPLVLDYEQFTQLDAMTNDIKGRLVCAFVERFNEPFIRAKEWTVNHPGPYEMHFVRRTKKPIRQDWVRDASKGGNIILDLAIHDIDASLWFSGAHFKSINVRQVGADREKVSVVLSDGSLVHYDAGWDVPQDSEAGIINTFTISNAESTYEYDSSSEQVSIDGVKKTVLPRFPKAYEAELHAARNLATGTHSNYPSFEELRETQRTLNELLKVKD